MHRVGEKQLGYWYRMWTLKHKFMMMVVVVVMMLYIYIYIYIKSEMAVLINGGKMNSLNTFLGQSSNCPFGEKNGFLIHFIQKNYAPI